MAINTRRFDKNVVRADEISSLVKTEILTRDEARQLLGLPELSSEAKARMGFSL